MSVIYLISSKRTDSRQYIISETIEDHRGTIVWLPLIQQQGSIYLLHWSIWGLALCDIWACVRWRFQIPWSLLWLNSSGFSLYLLPAEQQRLFPRLVGHYRALGSSLSLQNWSVRSHLCNLHTASRYLKD